MKLKVLTIALLGMGLSLSVAQAHDDEGYGGYHGGDGGVANGVLHAFGIPHSHGGYGDGGDYNEYLHENGIPHTHYYHHHHHHDDDDDE